MSDKLVCDHTFCIYRYALCCVLNIYTLYILCCPVQSPSSLTLNSETYSSYKGSTTLKGLVGIAPSGVVAFVSLLFSGCISDKHITKASGVLDLLEPGDQVMVDKGFLIQEELAAIGCSFVIPNFLAAKGQCSVDEVSENEANGTSSGPCRESHPTLP